MSHVTGCLPLLLSCLQAVGQGRTVSPGTWAGAARALGLIALQEEGLAVQLAQSGALTLIAARLAVPTFKVDVGPVGRQPPAAASALLSGSVLSTRAADMVTYQ